LLRTLVLAGRTLLPLGLLLLFSAILLGCGSSGSEAESAAPSGGSISIATVTPVVQNGGKVEATATTTTGQGASTPASTATKASTPVTAQTPASTGTAASTGNAPTTGKWIDVDVTRFVVKLMNGTQIVQTISPVAVGAAVNTGEYESTQTGLFYVYNKIAGLQYDAPYSAYISDWVGFDPQKANGFHSFLQDQTGAVTDPATGRVSNGCIRTGASKVIFDYADIGTAVYVHL
jgi:hypothetical protein